MPRMARQLRRRAGMPKKSRQATAIPPPTAKNLFSGRARAPLVAAVLLIVIVAVALPLVTLTVGGIEHVGEFVAPDGLEVREHVRLTVPVKPPDGVTVMVEVLPVVAPGARLGMLTPERAKPALGLRVIGILRVALVKEPTVAVTSAV